ncbi:MAG TPA: DUF4389 domain-containing protein [Acidimicrobiia bacterium]|nr:DUF4389 domain-containing protein [Acidimicrobiia bacterium]
MDFRRDLAVDRWRPIVNWILAIPHLIIAYILILIERVLGIICFFTILFTKQVPEPIFNFRVMAYRYLWRAVTYAGFMRNEYPPFSFETVAQDDGIDAASLSMDPQAEYNRWAPLYKWLIAFPHYLVLFVLEIGSFIAWVVAFFAVIVTGEYPQALRDFNIGVFRWYIRVDAYVYLMDDAYPPFSLQ